MIEECNNPLVDQFSVNLQFHTMYIGFISHTDCASEFTFYSMAIFSGSLSVPAAKLKNPKTLSEQLLICGPGKNGILESILS